MKTYLKILSMAAAFAGLSLSGRADVWMNNAGGNWSTGANWNGTGFVDTGSSGLETTTALNVSNTVTINNDLNNIVVTGAKLRGTTAIRLTGNAVTFSGYQWLLENVSQPITYQIDNDFTFTNSQLQLQLNQGGTNIGVSPGISFNGKFINGYAGGSLTLGSWDATSTPYSVHIADLYLANAGLAANTFNYNIYARSVSLTVDRIHNQTADSASTNNYGVSIQWNGNGNDVSAYGKTGLNTPGTVTFTGVSDYKGATSVGNYGILIVGATADISTSSGVTLANTGQLYYNSSTRLDKLTWQGGGILGGSGNILASAGGFYNGGGTYTIRPGDQDQAGALHFVGNGAAGSDNVTWNNGATVLNYDWQFDGAALDQIAISGTLTLGAAGTYNLNASFLGAADSAALQDYIIAHGGALDLITAGSVNWNGVTWNLTGLDSGIFSLQQNATGLQLLTIPEPSAWLLLLSGATLALTRRRRR